MKKPNTKNAEPLKLSPDLIAKNKSLQKELKQAKTDLEILKEVTAYFTHRYVFVLRNEL